MSALPPCALATAPGPASSGGAAPPCPLDTAWIIPPFTVFSLRSILAESSTRRKAGALDKSACRGYTGGIAERLRREDRLLEADREGGRAGNSALEGRLCGIWTEPPPSPAAVSGGVFRVKEAERRPSGAIWVVPRFLRPMIGAEVFFIGGPFAGKGRSSRAASGNCGNRGREVDPKTIGTGAVPAGLRHGPATAPEAGRGGPRLPGAPGGIPAKERDGGRPGDAVGVFRRAEPSSTAHTGGCLRGFTGEAAAGDFFSPLTREERSAGGFEPFRIGGAMAV